MDTVIFTGGEPTLQKEIYPLIEMLNQEGFKIGIHTNGSNPSMIEKLIKNNLLTYISMDIKNSKEKYLKTIGLRNFNFKNIEKTINLIKKAPKKMETVFRTTVVPSLIELDDMSQIGKMLKKSRLIALQQFRPLKCLDSRFEKLKPYDKDILHKMADMLEKYVDKVDRSLI